MCVCRRMPFARAAAAGPRAAGGDSTEIARATGCGARVRALPAVPPADAGDRGDRVPRAAGRGPGVILTSEEPCRPSPAPSLRLTADFRVAESLRAGYRRRFGTATRDEALNPRSHRSTFQPMPSADFSGCSCSPSRSRWAWPQARSIRRSRPADPVSTIGAPRESLPPPVHDEATCAFCQAAIFPPCAPQPTTVSLDALGVVRQECAAADEATPHFTTHRLTTTRAPPTLRSA